MPSIQFVITDRMSLLSPLSSNGRSIPLNRFGGFCMLYTEKILYDLSLLYSVLGLTDKLNAFFPLGKHKKEKNNISVWSSFQR